MGVGEEGRGSGCRLVLLELWVLERGGWLAWVCLRLNLTWALL